MSDSVLGDCIDEIRDLLSDAIEHNGACLLTSTVTVEMECRSDFDAAPLIVRVNKDDRNFQCELHDVTRAPRGGLRSMRPWLLSYFVERY